MRIHVFGASGSGTTTFGRALASRFFVPHHDTDEYYWEPTEIPFSKKRPIASRLDLMESMFLGRSNWVLSGSLVSWSATITPYFELAIFLTLDNTERLKRIQQREVIRCGEDALAPGGSRYTAYQNFMAWNSGYETSAFNGRSRKLHEDWMKTLSCPVIRLDSRSGTSDLVKETEFKLSKIFNEENRRS